MNTSLRRISRIVHRLLVLLAVLTTAGPAAYAIDVEFATRPVKREILALYDSRHEATPTQSRIHRLAEMPLNWLGFKVTFVDVNGELPPADQFQKYRGLVTWFNEPLADTRKVLAWVDSATATGLRYACLGEIAPPEPAGSEPTSPVFSAASD